MKSYKPDLNEKITIRLSVARKKEIRDLCEQNDWDESVVARAVLEAGIQLAREKGMMALLEKREKPVESESPVKKTSKKPQANHPFIIQKKETGNTWELLNPAGERILSGPLYKLRPKAKSVCPPGGSVVIHQTDGRIEQLV